MHSYNSTETVRRHGAVRDDRHHHGRGYDSEGGESDSSYDYDDDKGRDDTACHYKTHASTAGKVAVHRSPDTPACRVLSSMPHASSLGALTSAWEPSAGKLGPTTADRVLAMGGCSLADYVMSAGAVAAKPDDVAIGPPHIVPELNSLVTVPVVFDLQKASMDSDGNYTVKLPPECWADVYRHGGCRKGCEGTDHFDFVPLQITLDEAYLPGSSAVRVQLTSSTCNAEELAVFSRTNEVSGSKPGFITVLPTGNASRHAGDVVYLAAPCTVTAQWRRWGSHSLATMERRIEQCKSAVHQGMCDISIGSKDAVPSHLADTLALTLHADLIADHNKNSSASSLTAGTARQRGLGGNVVVQVPYTEWLRAAQQTHDKLRMQDHAIRTSDLALTYTDDGGRQQGVLKFSLVGYWLHQGPLLESVLV